MKCPNCENFVDEKAEKCPYCGYMLKAEPKVKADSKNEPLEDKKKKKSRKKGSRSSGAGKFILLIAVAVCVFFAIVKSGSDDQITPVNGGPNAGTESLEESEMTIPAEMISEPEPTEEPMQEGFIFADSDRRLLSEEEVEALSQEEMRIARNELYARKGRRFQSEDLQNYFDSQEWYNGTIEPGDFVESNLNAYETYNRDLILRIEQAKGYR